MEYQAEAWIQREKLTARGETEMAEEKTPLEMAEELNDMERDMTSAEADFHDRVLVELRAGKKLKPKDEGKLELLYEKYFANAEDEEETSAGGEDEEVDENDF